MKRKNLKSTPLRVSVKNGLLTVEIGVDTLAFAALRSDAASPSRSG